MPKISIITPALVNSTDKILWLSEMIDSVKNQSFQDWELIIVDDCSPLNLGNPDPNDERIRYFRMVNHSGPAICRNTAAELARADCLLPLDSDDLLATNDTLALMYKEWEADKKSIVYGDIQRIGVFPKKLELPDYTFIRILDLNGIIPVTAMHSKECFEKAGGWKPEFEAGLEDVEYWISAGKAGFCGKHIKVVTLNYRKHDGSRTYNLQRVSRRETEMRNLIRELHTDVYEGRYPMGCCGGGRAVSVPRNRSTLTSVAARISTLDNFSRDETVWVKYSGKKEGSFGAIGPYSKVNYVIQGPGHILQVHRNDLSLFSRSGRGKDFIIGVPSPANGKAAEEEVVHPTEISYSAPKPRIGKIERLDRIANNG